MEEEEEEEGGALVYIFEGLNLGRVQRTTMSLTAPWAARARRLLSITSSSANCAGTLYVFVLGCQNSAVHRRSSTRPCRGSTVRSRRRFACDIAPRCPGVRAASGLPSRCNRVFAITRV